MKPFPAVLLGVFLMWRLAVASTVWKAPGDWRAGLSDSREQRLTRALSTWGGTPSTAERVSTVFALIRQHVPEHAQLYVLVDRSGSLGLFDLYTVLRFARMLAPCFIQPLFEWPLPATAHEGALAERPIWVLDLRAGGKLAAAGFEQIAAAPVATLWRHAE